MEKFLQFIIQNLDHVAPILIAGAVGAVIIVERMVAILVTYPIPRPRSFYENIRNLVMTERIGEAIAFCDRYGNKPMATVVREGLLRVNQPETVIENGLEVALGEALERTGARTNFLSMIANVATLLGLFGTIIGLIQSFDAVGSANAQQRSALLAAGISTAMNATMLGLAVAIPCMVAFSFLTNKTNRLNAELERAAIKTLDFIRQRYFSPGNESQHSQPHIVDANQQAPQRRAAR